MQTIHIDMALKTAEKLHAIREDAQTKFFERNDAIHALTSVLSCGEHMLLLGRPGTSKTAMGNFFAQSTGLKYYYRGLNADTKMEDLLGPVSPTALKRDEWTRKWSGLATSHIGFCDEAGKASNTVQDFLLGAMQERIATIADTVHHMPLHTLISGTNETLDDNPAFYDRFLARIRVDQIQDEDNFAAMLVSDLAPCDHPIDPEELVNLRQVTRFIALQADRKVIGKLVQIKNHFTNKMPHYISDRRWKAGLPLAAGHALLRGESKIEVPDLHVYKWLLWTSEGQNDLAAHIRAVYTFVEEQCNAGLKDLREQTALLEEVERKILTFTADTSPDDLAMTLYRASQIRIKSNGKTTAEWKKLLTRADKVIEQVNAINMGATEGK